MMKVSQMVVLGVACMICCIAYPKKANVTHPQKPQIVYNSRTLATEIDRIVNNETSNASIGVYVKSMKYGDTLYAQNEYKLFTPASIIKILTAEAALLFLGPDFKFPTTLLTDAKNVNNGVINGNLYLVHSGDPSLTYNDLTDMMEMLKSQSIQGIRGNIYIDNTAYDQTNLGPGWVWDDTRYCYAAPINASIINKNCVSFRMTPAKKAGQLASIVPSQHYFYGAIQNAVTTKPPKTRSCYVQTTPDVDGRIAVSGCMPKGKHVWGVTTVIGDIMQYNKMMLQSLFKRFGIHVNGQVSAGAAPAKLSAIAVHESKPLHSLVSDMLKMSDNIIAGSLFKKMGEFYKQEPGSWKNGSEAVTHILSKKAGVNSSQMVVLDGSGLSRYNKVKPSQLMRVLEYAYHNKATNYQFISALPIAGVDGTLKYRLPNLAYRVRAKTGTMAHSGIVSLAGYVTNRDKEPLAFVIIINGRYSSVWKYREMEDQIVTALANHSRG
jgi:serine-type D-Ala-D-Ala carboxypeptidase/endopeptidase (penicillin-binding protein 4)